MTAILGVKNNPGAKMCRQDPFKQNRGNNKKIKGVLISYCSFLSIIKENQVNYFQLRAKSLWISPISQFLRSSYYIDTPPFGQRPRRGRNPVEHRENLFVHLYVRLCVHPSPLAPSSGLRLLWGLF